MTRAALRLLWATAPLLLATFAADLSAQKPPYDVFPPAEVPYLRIRYEASTKQGELPYAVNYTIWIPKDVKSLRGVIVHQHGCGEGSCKSGLTGAYDLHWQALARKHDCALLSPSYEQPEKADCQMWCDPRNGSDAAFQKCLVDLGTKSGHPELAKVPWALWGHSGGGHWAGGMVLLHPERVAAAWLRSGVPLLKADPQRTGIKAHTLPEAALKVPMMCNLGTKEGVTVKNDRFSGVWPANEAFFNEVRSKGGLVGVAVDPLTSHECGNQRYFAIPWLDACLSARLPKVSSDPLVAMPADKVWLASPTGAEAVEAAKFKDEPLKAAWLPNEAIAKAWMQYVKDTAVTDTTPPPAPTNVQLKGNELTWDAEADLESGLASFIIERDGKVLANVPEQGKNPFGRPVFQNLQYSDTPAQPLIPMRYTDTKAEAGKKHTYRVIAVNTAGLKSKPSADSQPPANDAAWEPAARAKEHPWMSIATWKKMHEGHLARTKKGGVDVMFLGDSITQGWGGAGEPVWKKRFEPLNAANYGIGGDTTREVLYRLNDGILDGIKPKAVVLLIGTNNFGLFGDSAADTAKGVEAVVKSVRKKAPDAKILLLGIFPRDKAANTAARKKITETNEAIAKVADGKTVVYLDIGKKFLADDGTLPAEVMPDALHLSEKGYGIWADAIEEQLKTLLK